MAQRPPATSSIPERFNASVLLDENLDAGRGGNEAIRCGDETVTYAALFARACRFASLLGEIGVGRRERVLVAMDDCTWLPAVFLGAMRVGAIPIPVNPFYRDEDEYAYFLDDSGAKAVVAGGPCAEVVIPAASGRVDPARVFSADGARDGAADLESSTAGLAVEVAPADTHRHDPAFWLYSSGSTGRPKGIVHRQQDIRCTYETYGRHVLEIEESDTTFSTTKLFHAYGLGNNLSFPYAVGAATVLLAGRPTPEAVFATVARYRPTLFFSVPTVYNALLRADDGGDFTSVRRCLSAAEPLPAEIWTRWRERHGLEILDGIGSTELLHIYCSNTTGDIAPGSSGRPVPGYELKLVEDGDDVPGAGVGELYVRGGSALAEYWNQPERTRESLRDGWFQTHDRYRRDDDGRYWYDGRTDDMFKVSGLWVSPATVEAALLEHPAVAESAVVATTIDGLQRGKAFVVLADRADVDEAELREFCSARLHRYEVPDAFAFVDDLPKTLTGKIQRFLLRGR